MVHTHKYMVNPGLKQEIKIIFGKPPTLSGFCEVGEVSVYWKMRFSSRSTDISRVYAVTWAYECTIPKYKVSGINLLKDWFLKRYHSKKTVYSHKKQNFTVIEFLISKSPTVWPKLVFYFGNMSFRKYDYIS